VDPASRIRLPYTLTLYAYLNPGYLNPGLLSPVLSSATLSEDGLPASDALASN
jgi:hypothetical protein